MTCPCGTGRDFDSCCGALHDRRSKATSAEALMRSRYSAFVVGDHDYLMWTWHPDTRPDHVRQRDGQEWTGLTIVDTAAGGMLDTEGIVSFIAGYRIDGVDRELRETSRFVKIDGHWLYLDADEAATVRP